MEIRDLILVVKGERKEDPPGHVDKYRYPQGAVAYVAHHNSDGGVLVPVLLIVGVDAVVGRIALLNILVKNVAVVRHPNENFCAYLDKNQQIHGYGIGVALHG